MLSETQREFTDVIRIVWPDWEIIEKLGSGAFATVFRASRKEKIAGEKDSAIKIIRIPQEDTDWDQLLAEGKSPAQAREYFQEAVDDALKEIRAMEDLGGHTNIVNIYDYKLYKVLDRDVWYILIRMEYLQKINAESFDEAEIRKLGTDVCTALSICRKKNIVHRDVSLDNIFIHDGNYKLGDFGVAKVLEGTVGGMHSIAGKPLYMAPEVYNATLTDTDMDSVAKVDLYSLGILLYRLSNNMKYPFEDPESEKTTASERNEAFRRRVIDGETLPAPVNASPEMAAVILKACEANPDRRYGSAEEFRDALLALKSETKQRRISWKKVLILSAALAVLVCVWFFVLNPLLFPEWSEWSEWTESRQEISDPDQIQEDEKTAYKWKAVQCPECGEENWDDHDQCVQCGAKLPVEFTDDNNGQPLKDNKHGRIFENKSFLYVDQITQYRYRTKGQYEMPKEQKKYYHISVVAPDGMSDEDFAEAQRILNERVDVFTGDLDYSWELKDQRIELLLPAEAFANKSIDNVFRSYLTRPARLYAIDQSDKSHFTEITYHDLESVTVLSDPIEGVNPADFEMEAADFKYIQIVLTDAFFEEHKADFASWDRLAFAQDYEEFPTNYGTYVQTVFLENGKICCFVSDDPENIDNLIINNLTHKPLQRALGYIADLNSITDWMDPDHYEHKGIQQFGPDEIAEPSVTFCLVHSETLSEGNKLDAERALIKRLDAIGAPYAMGTQNNSDGKMCYVIKTGLSRMGYPIIKLLCEKGLMYIQSKSLSARMGYDQLDWSSGENGSSISVRLNENVSKYYSNSFHQLMDEAAKNNEYLYFTDSDGFPFFATAANDDIENGLPVTEFCEIQQCRYSRRKLDESMTWLADLMQAIAQSQEIPTGFYLDGYQLNRDAKETDAGVYSFAFGYNTDTTELDNSLREIWPYALSELSSSYLHIYLDQAFDTQNPETAPELVKKVYEQLDFLSLYHRTAFIYFRNNQQKTMLSFSFSKRQGYEENDLYNNYISADAYLYGDQKEYRDKLFETIRNMSFYQEFTDKYSSWYKEE